MILKTQNRWYLHPLKIFTTTGHPRQSKKKKGIFGRPPLANKPTSTRMTDPKYFDVCVSQPRVLQLQRPRKHSAHLPSLPELLLWHTPTDPDNCWRLLATRIIISQFGPIKFKTSTEANIHNIPTLTPSVRIKFVSSSESHQFCKDSVTSVPIPGSNNKYRKLKV